MIRLQEFPHWSVMHGKQLVRVSAFDQRGSEYFMLIEPGRQYRERREDAAELIGIAMRQGLHPGEVRAV